MIVDYVGIST